MDIKKLFDRACNGAGSIASSLEVLCSDSFIRGCVPLRDVLTGVFNGSPIPPDYLGEPHIDTDDTALDEVDPYASFGFDRLDREQYVLDRSSQRVEAEGHRARTARSRTAPRDGVLAKENASTPTPTSGSQAAE